MLQNVTFYPEYKHEPPMFLLRAASEVTTRVAFSPTDLVVDALGGFIDAQPWQTLNYRMKGTDSFTWGDQHYWAAIKGIRGLLFLPALPEVYADQEAIETRALEYGALLGAIVGSEYRYRPLFVRGLDRIEQICSLRDGMAVRRFLYSHQELVDVLLEAHAYLEGLFGPDPLVTLEVVNDPEVEGVDELFAYIFTSLSVDEALVRLKRLDNEWFLDQLDRVGDWFDFNLRFV